MNIEKNNLDLQETLEYNTSEVYIEDENGEEQSLTKLKKDEDIETAYDLSLKLWDINDSKESRGGDLKNAVEIAMNKTEPLIKEVVFLDPKKQDKLKTAADIAMERADKLIAEEEEEERVEQSKKDENNAEELLEEEEKKQTKENAKDSEPTKENTDSKEVKDEDLKEVVTPEEEKENLSEKINEISDKDLNYSENSSFALKTFKKWKKTFEKYSQNKNLEKLSSKMDNVRERWELNSIDISKIDLSIAEVKSKFSKAISEVKDRKIIELLEKNKKEQIDSLEHQKLEKSFDGDALKSEYWDLDTELKETTERINEIESKYFEKIDSKIQEVIGSSEYYEALDTLEVYSSKLKKFIKAYNDAENLHNSIKELLKSDGLISNEDRKELNKRAWNIKKRMAVYYQVITRIANNKINEKKYIQSVEKTISNLISLKK